MYGGSGKLGRGRGGGGGGGPVKRNIHSTFQPSSVQRPSTAAGRLSAGGGHRNRTNTPTSAAVTVSTADETFSLVRNNPLNFGMIIRLTPVLVEEIKRLEADGGAARIKFDSVANNPAGNVIDVGGKEFRFTWSQETGDLCDIYEERRSGDNGDGLLVESGGAWRKLNVQRELDDTTKNHVKMRTVEAELKHKSRKAIILDHGNPNVKNQMKALAAAEAANTWRGSYKNKKEPPLKKMKPESSSAVVPPKIVGKPGFSSSTPSKIRASASPLLSTPEQSGAPISPLKNSNLTPKVNANKEDAILTQFSKENASTFEKETFSRVPTGGVYNKQGSNERFGNKSTDLQSLITSLLMEKPQGMPLKALEKAVGETFPKSVKQIEPILRKIAVYQAPGKYILKPDTEAESFKKSLSESGSSPENNNHHRETTAPESSFPLKFNNTNEFEQPTNLIPEPYEEQNTSEKIDIEHRSPDILSDKKVQENSEGPTHSSSNSGSDSDSESSSSDSGSESGSHKSPLSSSDSESDASSNSKQASDEDVDIDIMSDDDKESSKIKSPPLDHHGNNIDGSDSIDLVKDLFEDNLEPDKDNYADETTTSLFADHVDRVDHVDRQESEVYGKNLHTRDENPTIDGFQSKNKSKRGSDENRFNENENSKRLKSGNWGYSESPYGRSTPNEPGEAHYNFNSDSPKSGPRSIDLNARAKAPINEVENTDVFYPQKEKANKKINKEAREEDGRSKDNKKPPKISRAQKKHDALIGKNNNFGLNSTSQIKDSTENIINGRAPTLRRELSDLEMGEFRENLNEEPSGIKNRFEKNNSFNKSENKSSSDYWNLDSSKPQSLPKKVIPEDHVDDFTKVNGKPSQRVVENVKSGSHHSKGVGAPHKHDKQVVNVNVNLTNNNNNNNNSNNRKQKGNDLGEKRKDLWENGNKRREIESFSDDSISSYTKYEKEEPEMKGPIRDILQYNEYVQEYREKYDCYHTLNKILESYRNEFQTFGRDLELAKGRDNERYNKILEQLMESYRQCGMKHKRLKKIFVVLHHELQHLKEMIKDFADKQTK